MTKLKEYRLEGTIKKNRMILVCLLIAVLSVIVRIPDFDNTDYHNSDATWHVLHTMRCYDQTPVSVHKFLPTVTLGGSEDKFISWGATIPDELGNYYYTSFSPAGFVAPFLFLKLFHIPISLMGLYVFNSLLYILCFALAARLFEKLLKTANRNFIWFVCAAAYLFQPEIMHSQGIVYWPQSLYQLIFLIQINLLFGEKTRKSFIALLVLCILGAYTEWTGYLVNCGIAFILFLTNKGKEKIIKSASVLFATVLAFALFCLHYLTTVDLDSFIMALKLRFMARNVAVATPFWQLGQGYAISFGLLLCIVLVCVVFALRNKETRKQFAANMANCKYLLIVCAFSLVENVIMKEHAVSYTFDRMKAIIPIMCILLCSIETMARHGKARQGKARQALLLITLFSIGIINLLGYKIVDTKYYVFHDPYLAVNQTIADDVNRKFSKDNSVMVCVSWVRGYLNVLFDRGIYENRTLDSAIQIAEEKGKQYAVAITPNYGYAYFDISQLEQYEAVYADGEIKLEQVQNMEGS
jgi:hypothetical protein